MELDLAIRTAKLLGYKITLICGDLYVVKTPSGSEMLYGEYQAIPEHRLAETLHKDLKSVYGIELDTPQITV